MAEQDRSTKLIELENGLLVEVVTEDKFERISGGAAEKVSATINQIKPILVSVAAPLAAAWKEINQEVHVEEAEVELGLSFEGEGNIYIVKGKSAANLTVKLLLKPLKQDGQGR